jgi:hypothetical protein
MMCLVGAGVCEWPIPPSLCLAHNG